MTTKPKSKKDGSRPTIPVRTGSPDDFQTPPEALEPLYPYLKPDWYVWEPACGRGNLVEPLFTRVRKVVGTDILTGCDFLAPLGAAAGIAEACDCIITNPPYKYKTEFIQRCYELGKPWALLMPLTTLETQKRQKLFKQYGLELILFDKRIHFETPGGKSGKESSAWFATAWFTWGLNIGQGLTFVSLDKPLRAKFNPGPVKIIVMSEPEDAEIDYVDEAARQEGLAESGTDYSDLPLFQLNSLLP